MTGTYDWNPIPHRVDVRCPVCARCAEFEFAEVVRISLKSDVAFFQQSSVFEYRLFQDYCGHSWHGALYFQGLHGDPEKSIHDLPTGYSPKDWAHSRYLARHMESVGSLRCRACKLHRKHILNWPDDAFYSLAYRGHVLWAYHRECATDLMQYLASTERNIKRYRWQSFLLHLPTVFKVGKARETVVKQLQKLLAAQP